MMLRLNPSINFFCALVLLLPLAFVSCAKAPAPDAKADLIGSLKDANLEGFFFESRDDDAQDIASMTNSIVAEPIEMDGDVTVVLRYARVKDKKANTANTYKVEAVKAGDQVTLQVTDIASGASLMKVTGELPALPAAPGDTCEPAFQSINDCTCTLRAALLFEANRTCTPQGAATLCCINGTQLFSVHLLVMPTRFLCQIGPLSDFDDLLFFRD